MMGVGVWCVSVGVWVCDVCVCICVCEWCGRDGCGQGEVVCVYVCNGCEGVGVVCVCVRVCMLRMSRVRQNPLYVSCMCNESMYTVPPFTIVVQMLHCAGCSQYATMHAYI